MTLSAISFKSKVVVVVALSLFLASVFSFSAMAEFSDDLKVTVNGQVVSFPDEKPFLDAETGRTFVPLRFVSEALEGKVTWDGASKMAIIEKGNTVIEMEIGSTNPVVDGESKALDAPARLENGRTLVPLRFISECFGASVQWDGESKTVIINDTPEIEVPDGDSGDSVSEDVYGDLSNDSKDDTSSVSEDVYGS